MRTDFSIRYNYNLDYLFSYLGIIYCFSQKECEQLCVDLCQSGITAGCYHANIKPCDKTHVHVQWTNNQVQVLEQD